MSEVINFPCGMSSDSYKDYVRLSEMEHIYPDNLKRRVQNFADCVAFVACIDCLDCCENKCKLFELVKNDLDNLFVNDNERFYKYLALMFEAVGAGEALIESKP